MVRHDDTVIGINIGNTHVKMSSYADDTIFSLNGTSDSLNALVRIIKQFYKISGLKLNFDKSNLIWVGSKKLSIERIGNDFGFSWNDGRCFTYLGINFSIFLDEMITLNYNKLLDDIKTLIKVWSRRQLTVLGKVVVVKSLFLSKLSYVATVLPSPNEAFSHKS